MFRYRSVRAVDLPTHLKRELEQLGLGWSTGFDQSSFVLATPLNALKKGKPMAHLEHININVPDGAAFTDMLKSVFGWHVRWEGPASDGSGYSRHVGEDDTYIAVYEPQDGVPSGGALNHLGIVVENLDTAAQKVRDLGLTPHHFADYEPGKRFYFLAANGLEIEVVEYA